MYQVHMICNIFVEKKCVDKVSDLLLYDANKSFLTIASNNKWPDSLSRPQASEHVKIYEILREITLTNEKHKIFWSKKRHR